MNAYTFHITPYDLAFVGIVFTGLTFVLLLWFTKRVNQAANRLLGMALLTVVLWIAWILGVDIGLKAYFPLWSWVPLQFSLVVGPLVFFYVRKITWPEHKFSRKDLLHLVPMLLQQGLFIAEISESVKTGAATYQTQIFQQTETALNLAVFISVAVYLYYSFRLIERFYKQQKFDYLNDRYRLKLQWLHRLLTGFGLLWLLWIPYLAADHFYYHNQPGTQAYYLLYLLLAAMMLGIAVIAFSKAETVVPAQSTPASPPLLPAALKQKGTWLKNAMDTNLYHQDPDLSLSSLAEILDVHPHELSRIINVALRKNFNDFVNEYRIREIIQKMQDPANNRLTLVGIAFDCGFRSKTTFNRVFREMTGNSAAEYKKLVKNERPTYHSGLYSRPAGIISYHDATPMWSSGKLNRIYMFRNHLKIAWRNLLRQKRYSLINISGLAVGLAVCMTIMLYVAHEHSYDRFQPGADRLVTIRVERNMNGMKNINPRMSFATGAMVKQMVPTIEDYSNYFEYFEFLPVVINRASTPKDKFSESNLLFANPNFFSFFNFKLISGNPSDVLTKPYSVVITQEMAKKYFGNENPVGKTLAIKADTTYTYQVTGVAKNIPSNSTINFNLVASVSTLRNYKGMFPYLGTQQIGEGFFTTYFRLKHVSDTARVAKTIQGILKKDAPATDKIGVLLPLLTDLHLKFNRDISSNIKYLSIFPLVAILTLLLALVNYMSLSTARSTLRAKEVGVRKISGAGRKTLATQFYMESTLTTSISIVLGYLLCLVFKPWFLNVLQLNIDGDFLYSPAMLLSLGALFIVTILIAGSYPALMLSSFKPVSAIKGMTGRQTGGSTVRKVFTVFQFGIATALIICGIVIDRQLYYFRHTDTGIDRENIVMVPIPGYFTTKYQPFKNELSALPGVADVGTSNYKIFNMHDSFGIKDKTGNNLTDLASQMVDKSFVSTLGLKWKIPPANGTELSSPNVTKVMINEAAVEQLHLPQNPVGLYLESERPETRLQIIGVLKNYNLRSMQYPVQPFALRAVPDNFIWTDPGCCLYIKIKPHHNLPSLINTIKTIYQKYDTETPFDYSFMDEEFNQQYKAEDRLASIFSTFTIITIVLAALGLFGLAAFSIEQRTKEIGIRKVLGASISGINSLLSKDFLKLVLLSIVISSPIAWWAMHNWLQSFAYRISVQWWMFGFAALLSIIVAVVTVSYHALKAAVANPVKSLRSE